MKSLFAKGFFVLIAALFFLTVELLAGDISSLSCYAQGAQKTSTNTKEVCLNQINQSEEHRDNKTFQVATIVINAAPEAVFKTFTDYKRTPKIFSHLKKAEILSEDGPKKRIACEAKIAGGLFEFQYVLEFIEHPPNLVEWHRVSGAFKANEGYWKFEPTDNGHSTLVTYSKYVDGGLLFPQFLVKKELHDNMRIILIELKQSVESDTKSATN